MAGNFAARLEKARLATNAADIAYFAKKADFDEKLNNNNNNNNNNNVISYRIKIKRLKRN